MHPRRPASVVLAAAVAWLAGCEAGLPTVAAEADLLARSQERSLERTLGLLPDIEQARVHLAVPPPPPSFAPQGATQPRASVLLLARPPHAPDVDAVQRLVAGAVGELRADQVTVTVSRGAELPTPPLLVAVGPFTVTAASAPWLTATLALSLALLAALAAALLWVLRRRRTP